MHLGKIGVLMSSFGQAHFDIPALAVKRSDAFGIRERILTLTQDERRKLGINKSTLWYQKKLSKGMVSKVYKKVLTKLV